MYFFFALYYFYGRDFALSVAAAAAVLPQLRVPSFFIEASAYPHRSFVQ